jgi:peptidoglycan L-alanyl-D-glutamate endopeptidase CwlK
VSAKLEGVHPQLARSVARILVAMAELGVPMLITDGVRTTEEQRALYAKGRTEPGRIVTNADGVRIKSNHQAKADGYGHAVDCCFLVDGKPSWDQGLPWRLYGEAAKALGLTWGGDWKTIVDKPHIELPGGM